ncbi:putative disease resistance protein RGA4 [Pistacia vera]|uniref:putative disease resistance protein RGA4 n=1 Tax=Pistacia vera TaxID=55513 RepID=UPI00126370EA|nr:putative disease resistance protein RGA4 [Pistacia vera]XP_031256587.1 putative disease resistance protein RGA4 [Pistacia vera]
MLQNFTSLQSLAIENFSKLKSFPTELVSLGAVRTLCIRTCHELESFPEQGLEGLNCLQHLDLINCRRFSSFSEGLGRLFYLERLNLNGCPELVALPDGIKYLSLLQHLTISGKFTGFDARYSPRNPGFHRLIVMKDSPEESDFRPKLVALPESLRHALALKELSISFYPNLASLPHWLGDLTSLRSLRIFDCPKLPSLPASFQSFTNLQNLGISECPELVKQCEKETGEGMTGTR